MPPCLKTNENPSCKCVYQTIGISKMPIIVIASADATAFFQNYDRRFCVISASFLRHFERTGEPDFTLASVLCHCCGAHRNLMRASLQRLTSMYRDVVEVLPPERADVVAAYVRPRDRG